MTVINGERYTKAGYANPLVLPPVVRPLCPIHARLGSVQQFQLRFVFLGLLFQTQNLLTAAGKVAAKFERSKRHLISAALRERTDLEDLESPIRLGRIRDWEAMEALWYEWPSEQAVSFDSQGSPETVNHLFL